MKDAKSSTGETTCPMNIDTEETHSGKVEVCLMSTEESDIDTPTMVIGATIEALALGETREGPVSGMRFLRNEISEKLNRENYIHTTPEQIVVSPGAKFSVFGAVTSLCGPGDEVIVPSPYWSYYPEIVRGAGANVVFLECSPHNNYEIHPDDLKAVVTERTKLLILNTPCNPTGTVYQRGTLTRIAEIAISANLMVLADEVYEKFIYDENKPHISVASLSPEINERTITINSFGNAYSMSGWRLGYMSAPRWLAEKVVILQDCSTSGPPPFAQYGAHKAMRAGDGFVDEMRATFSKRCDLIYGLLSDIKGLRPVKPSGAFYVLCDVSSFGLKSKEFCDRLFAEMKMAAAPGVLMGAEGFIRLSFSCPEKLLKEGVGRLRLFCEKSL